MNECCEVFGKFAQHQTMHFFGIIKYHIPVSICQNAARSVVDIKLRERRPSRDFRTRPLVGNDLQSQNGIEL